MVGAGSRGCVFWAVAGSAHAMWEVMIEFSDAVMVKEGKFVKFGREGRLECVMGWERQCYNVK